MQSSVKGKSKAKLSANFELVIVPAGMADADNVVGTVRNGAGAPRIRLDRSRVIERFLAIKSAAPDENAQQASMAEIPADPMDSKAQYLLDELAQTMGRLRKARNDFHDDLVSALAEGEELLKKSAA